MNTRPSRPGSRAAFTLIELLIVIAIFVLLLAVAVPAFSSMLYSSEQSLAENSLRAALSAARDVAIRNAEGGDGAAVFFYDPTTKRTTIVPCVSVGLVKDDADPTGLVQIVDREIFVPAAGFEPTQMPRGWTVRGYAPPNTIDLTWYGDDRATNLYRYAANAPVVIRGNWLFPETGFYDEEHATRSDGADRQTFMVRFEGGTGSLRTSDLSAVLVLAVSPGQTSLNTSPWNKPNAPPFPYRPDLEPDPARFVRRVTAAPIAGPISLNIAERGRLVGDVSNDTVLAKAVMQVAVCNEKRLAQAIGVRLDPATDSLYRDPSVLPERRPELLLANDLDLIGLNDWIEGHLRNPSGPTPPAPGAYIDSDCRIFTVQRYLGTLQEISGTANGQGVQ